MARRPDVIDRVLEHWASWRITLELYEGTGPSAIVRFREPACTTLAGSRPLFCGNVSRRLAALNADLAMHLGSNVNLMLALYGLPGEDSIKARQVGICLSNLNTIRKRARAIALWHISPRMRITTGDPHDQLRTEAAG